MDSQSEMGAGEPDPIEAELHIEENALDDLNKKVTDFVRSATMRV